MSQLLDTKIEFLKGVGPLKAEALKSELGIFTVGDLIEARTCHSYKISIDNLGVDIFEIICIFFCRNMTCS